MYHGTVIMPTDKTAQEAENITLILAEMEEGNSLRKACREHGVAPSTFLLWVDKDPELAEQYARARVRMLDVQAEELEDIGDQAIQASDAVQVAGLRLKSDNRKWLLSKLAAKKYGDKQLLEHSGPDGKPIEHTLTVSASTKELLGHLSGIGADSVTAPPVPD